MLNFIAIAFKHVYPKHASVTYSYYRWRFWINKSTLYKLVWRWAEYEQGVFSSIYCIYLRHRIEVAFFWFVYNAAKIAKGYNAMPLVKALRRNKCNGHLSSSRFMFVFPHQRLSSAVLRFSFLLLIIANIQKLGEGLDFCFDGSNEGKLMKFDVFMSNVT